MPRSIRLTIVATVVGALAVPATLADATSVPSTSSCAASLVSGWSDARLANEVIAVSVPATSLGAMAPAARAGYGGLLLFGSTAPAHMAGIVATLQRERPDASRFAVMSDEEGGGVMRMTNAVPSIPWAMDMGARFTPAGIAARGRAVGRALAALGVNVDLAPVVDLDARRVVPGARDPDGLRSFGADPVKTSTDAAAFAAGLRAAGVAPVLKHFPGLGGSSYNTDYGPARTRTWANLRSRDVTVFSSVLAAGPAAVMVSNARVPGLTSQPASVSPSVMTYLRDQMGFGGVIVTDSLGAGAISAAGLSESAAAVKAVEAGADLVLAGGSASPAASLSVAQSMSSAIQAALTSGSLSRATLEAAASQVVAWRSALSC